MAGDTFDYLRTFARFPLAISRFLRRPLTLDDARRIVADRLAHREANFLRIVEASVYGNPTSPYLELLRLAGCDWSDLCALVKGQGLEGALQALRNAGVYVTFEEFKGRKPIVRGGTTIPVSARDFDNHLASRDLTLTTGGSTGVATQVHLDLDYIAATVPSTMLMLDAWEVFEWPAVHWMHILPGGGLRFILQRARFGRRPRSWYSQHGWFDSRSWLKYDLATFYTMFWINLFGTRVPLPTIVKPDRAIEMARHLRRVLDEDGHCLIYCGVSAGVRIALAAEDAGINLAGTTIRVGGEPITPAKVAPMRRIGMRVLPTYGAIETGPIGLGCAQPAETDHVHVAADTMALITQPLSVEETGVTVQAFNLTSLVGASPKVMLNYQIDDYGVVESRACGCPLHARGYTTSLHTIQSYSKLLGESVTLLGTDIQRVMEEVLPARFGGSALDYQLMEDDDARGLTRVYLIISPRVEITDEAEVVRVLIGALRASSPTGDIAGSAWEQAGTLHVLRQQPVSTSRGKQQTLYRRRPASRH